MTRTDPPTHDPLRARPASLQDEPFPPEPMPEPTPPDEPPVPEPYPEPTPPEEPYTPEPTPFPTPPEFTG